VPLPPGDDDFDGPGGPSGQPTQQPTTQQQSGDRGEAVAQQQPWFQQQPWLQQPLWYPPPPPPSVHVPQKVKLPPFWSKDAAAWFSLAESVFDGLRLSESTVRYQQVLMALPPDVVERVRGVLNAAAGMQDPYKALKERVVELLTPNTLDQLNSIIWGPELGGQRPSELMEVMLASLPAGETDGLLFKALFLHRLPSDIRDLVALQLKRLSSRDLAAHADNLWFARNANKTGGGSAVAAVADTPVDNPVESELVAAVKKLVANNNKKGSKGGKGGGSGKGGARQGGGGKNGGDGFICWKHAKFGAAAHYCADQQRCIWSGNE